MERKVAELELGFFTSGYQRYPLEQAFEDASRFGYDYIELWGGYPHAYVEDLTARGVGEIDRLIQKYRMPVKCFTPEHNGYPFNYMAGDEFQWERSMVYLEKAIELTAAMGAPMMLFSAGCVNLWKSCWAISISLLNPAALTFRVAMSTALRLMS